MPTVTALRESRRGRVAVELDGARWRTLPPEVVVRAGLTLGRSLDRPALRLLRQELRRAEALGAAARALHSRDHSVRSLDARLERARVTATERGEAIATLARAGLVDDRKFAVGRAESLAARGHGDLAIRAALEREGIESSLRDEAVGGLPAESARAAALVKRRGDGPRTARYLARRGFGEEAVESALAGRFAPDP